MASFHRLQTEEWLKTIDVKVDRLIDIGGSQLPIKGRTKSWSVKDYEILDLEVPHECKQKPDIIWDINIDCSIVAKHGELYFEQGCYDVVFCIEVSEYFYNPSQALENINRLLKQGGILYITFPFSYMQHKPEGTDYLRYTPIGAEKLLKEAGFEVLEHRHRLATSDKLETFYQEERMKGLPEANHRIIGSMIKCKKL